MQLALQIALALIGSQEALSGSLNGKW